MLRWTLLAVVAVTTAILSPSAGAEPGSWIEGRILDTTCVGPCSPQSGDWPPYVGPAEVTIRRLSRGRVATVVAEDGRFHIRVGPGRYQVRARIDDPCWEGDAELVRVRHQDVRVELLVYNRCIQ